MAVRGVRAKTVINPQAETVAKLPANLGDRFVSQLMIEVAVLLLNRYREKQKLGDPIGEIFFDLLLSRRHGMTNVAAQSGNWLFLGQAFDHKKRLNQLRAIELGLGAQVAQVLRTSQAHQSLHH